jgi:hypothetical protein
MLLHQKKLITLPRWTCFFCVLIKKMVRIAISENVALKKWQRPLAPLAHFSSTFCASCSFFVDLLRLLLIFRNKKLKTVSQHYVESKNNCVEFPSFISTFWDETEMLACSTAGLQEELHTRDEELLSLQQEYRCTVSACPINIHVTILPPVFRIRKIF